MAKIMLCDDSGTILLMLERKLKEFGHDVVGKAKDGDEGVTVYNKLKPDLLILDVTMPNKDGRECLKEIITHHPSAKIIMLTALLEKTVVDECMSIGAKAFVSKSNMKDATFMSDLQNLITQVLKVA